MSRSSHTVSVGAIGVLAAAAQLASSSIVGAQSSAAGRPLLPFAAVERQLANGLKVIIVPTGFPNLVSLQIPVQTGSRNEVEPGKSGFAHFFEHMMFRGTARYSSDAYQRILTTAGARQNAYTNNDFTNYHTTFAKEDLATMLEIEADRFQNLAYSEEAFKTEARAVLGEYNKNSAEPTEKLFEAQRELAFTTHPYRHTTMGFLADIEDMPNQFAYAKTFFSRWYRPEYTTLIVAGDVSADAVMPLVEKYWGAWKAGTYKADIPREPEPSGPRATHVTWPTSTLPWVTMAFHAPQISETSRDFAAFDMLLDLTFGPTSDLYKRLVVDEQRVDDFGVDTPATADPSLATVYARLKKPEDALYVRDAIVAELARVRVAPPTQQRLDDAKSNARYALLRSLDNTESIAALLARYVRFRRSFDTLNNVYRVYDSLTPADLLAAAQTYLTDRRLVQTTLATGRLDAALATIPSLMPLSPAGATPHLSSVVQRSPVPQLNVKMLFKAGSAHDPQGKEGLARLTASMIADAGSRSMRIDEIEKAFFPMAGSFDASVDKEMTVFTARVHRDNWPAFSAIALPMLTAPGFREDDFTRLKAQQLNALTQDLRSNNEEELAKEWLQHDIFAGTRYAHPVLGTEAGLSAITLDDVKAFARRMYSRAALEAGLSGDLPADVETTLARDLAALPDGTAPAPVAVTAAPRKGITVDIIEKDTRATAVSFGHPIAVTRAHPDFAALSVARAWLGEHRSSGAHLFQRIRDVRGMNYGDYAYIEAFPGGMFTLLPPPHVARRAQLFEIWIRPVVPENAHMALRIAVWELRALIDKGLSQQAFDDTRNYLMKNVYLLTARQDHQLGYALDQKWYGLGEYTADMRDRLSRLTREDVNRAVRTHLSATDFHVVAITKDAAALKQRLIADTVSTVTYDAPKPAAIVAEDKVIGALKLNIAPGSVVVTPVDSTFKN
jgi:zinc protease